MIYLLQLLEKQCLRARQGWAASATTTMMSKYLYLFIIADAKIRLPNLVALGTQDRITFEL